MSSLKFRLEIDPRPKQRPRFGRGRTYTPKETVNYEREINLLSRPHISAPLSGPLALRLVFVYPRLKSARKSQQGRIWKATKPDASNLAKAVEDGLEGLAYLNDAQLARVEIDKVYGQEGEQPHIEVELKPLEELPPQPQISEEARR